METLLQLRKSKNLTQKDIADALGISRQAYANYETGNREPDLNTLKALSEFFGVSTDYLLNNQKENPADEGEIAEDVVIYHRDGKTVRRTFTKEQLDTITRMLDAIPDKPKDI